MRALGGSGLRAVAEHAVLNARHLASLIADTFPQPYPKPCMHEFVSSAEPLKKQTGVRAMDVAKGLLDRGIHAPTMYFPLIVDEALMLEPTESESPETVEAIAEALLDIARAAQEDPDSAHEAPRTTPVRRPDEAAAARHLVLTWAMEDGG
jgi:glycine dehydrogenase subunit 2